MKGRKNLPYLAEVGDIIAFDNHLQWRVININVRDKDKVLKLEYIGRTY